MRFLLTGATGYLGSSLCRELVNRQHHVAALVRAQSDLARIKAILPQMQLFDMDAVAFDRILDSKGGFDAVIHMATCYGRGGESVAELAQVNIATPLRLLELCAKRSIPFVNTDSALPREVSQYALSKAQFAEWCRAVAESSAASAINIRIDQIYGPGNDTSKFTAWILQECMSNAPVISLTQGAQIRDFVYIDDVVSAYILLLELVAANSSGCEEYSIGSGEPMTIRRFCELVRGLTKSRTLLQFGAVPYRDREPMEIVNDASRLMALGWRTTTSVEDGIRLTIRHGG